MQKMRYRLALDLGSTSLGWAMLRLNAQNEPCAIIKAGVRIFSDGRNPKDGASLAVTRRAARAMRRRRDRLLKRKARMLHTLVAHGFFPQDEAARKALETLNPYELRAKGLDEALQPAEFARALFHINQRRGFKSNRKTDKSATDSGALKSAISTVRGNLAAFPSGNDGKPLKINEFDVINWLNRSLPQTADGKARSVGELLWLRAQRGETVRAKTNGLKGSKLVYDLYIDRAMIEAEFDALWAKQTALNPALFNETAGAELKDCLLHQRPLKPVKPGRCTLIPEQERAPLALPSTQRFRIYQEVNNLRILRDGLAEDALTLEQRDKVVDALERHFKRSFIQIRKLLGLPGTTQFNIEDAKRTELKGNTTSAILSSDECFGDAWYAFEAAMQDEIVTQLVQEENEARLIAWLTANTGVDEATAETIANKGLPDGYGSLSAQALSRILPQLKCEVITYDKAVLAAGFEHHSHISPAATGEILDELPYYGQALQRHVGFGTGNPEDAPEKRYGKIANPTVHIGLNQVRTVVNALIKRYGHPSEVIVEVARDLKQSQEQRKEETERQAKNQKRNERLREEAAAVLGIAPLNVKIADVQKMILWEELSFNVADRRCPYSGEQISATRLLSSEVEIEHILPFSRTLDDSLNNKTVSLREANRFKGNMTPWEAFGQRQVPGFSYDAILQRAEAMPKGKRYRFGEDGYKKWLKDDAGFLPRALNDTRYLSRVAREYVSLICPQDTRVIPGQMTAMLRAKFGLNDVLGLNGEKNRNDHRHHAVDACVIGVTDQGMLQRFAQASASARDRQLNRLVENMPEPWPTYRAHVARAVSHIWVSHKPDHGHEGAMHNDTAYGLRGEGRVGFHKEVEGKRTYIEDNLKVIPFTSAKAAARHGLLPNGQPRPYKGYKGDSNYCIEIVRNEKGKWEGEVISTFQAYQLVRPFKTVKEGIARLRHPSLSLSGRPLVMRLVIDDLVKLEFGEVPLIMRVASINSAGRLSLAAHHEANVDARNRDTTGDWRYTYKQAGSLYSAKARRVTISPIGELRDPGFKG